MASPSSSLLEQAQAVLKQNDRGQWTVPSQHLYPHQWLWDSSFIAIGQRHYDPRRAATELQSLFRGQWTNGMLPHVVLTESKHYWADDKFWRSNLSPLAPAHINTSALTQPPVVAIAVLAVAKRMGIGAQQHFLKELYPKLLAYHRWIYNERDPDQRGLAVLIHPWESGMDNTPPWIHVLKGLVPFWISAFFRFKLNRLTNRLRKDIKVVPANQRISTIESLRIIHLIISYRRQRYDNHLVLANNSYAVEDLTFNSILIAANKALVEIAQIIAEDLPPELTYHFKQTEQTLEQLWSEETGQYYSRHFKSQELIKISSISTLLPLFAGSVSKQRAQQLVNLLRDANKFWPAHPIPTVPINSKYFQEERYWKGPTWLNMNWMIIKGLLNYGYEEEARNLIELTKNLIEQTGFYEYYSALTGKGLGIDQFSWTAALYIDLENLEI